MDKYYVTRLLLLERIIPVHDGGDAHSTHISHRAQPGIASSCRALLMRSLNSLGRFLPHPEGMSCYLYTGSRYARDFNSDTDHGRAGGQGKTKTKKNITVTIVILLYVSHN